VADNDRKKKRPRIAAGQRTNAQQWGIPGTRQKRAQEVDDGPGGFTLSGFLTRPTRQALNFFGDLTTGFQRNKFDSWGTGLGDTVFGVTRGYYDEKNEEVRDPRYNASQTLMESAWPTDRRPVSAARGRGNSGPGKAGILGRLQSQYGQGIEEPTEMSFSDILARAMEMFGGGGGGPSSVSYDPQREAARTNAAESDAKIAGIYNALSQSIVGDAAGIGSSYDQAKAVQQAAADQAQQNVQAGYQSANDMLSQQAAALGIQEAVANQINSGQANGGDMTQRLSDLAAQNAQAQSQLGTNRQSALDYNTAVDQAARQESASRRAALAGELRNILGQIDSAENEANASLANQYGSQQGQAQDSALSLAQWMYENQTDERRYQDDQSRRATELALKYPGQQGSQPPVNPESLRRLQELIGYSEDPGAFQAWLRDNMGYAVNFAKGLQ
jgi:hypothetical protein